MLANGPAARYSHIPMNDFIVLSCPCCAGQLRVTNDAERFACRHCGREHLVRRQGGAVNLVPLTKKLERVGRSMDRNASELAIKRLKEERKRIKRDVDGWRRDLWHAKQAHASARMFMQLGYGAGIAGLLVAICSFFAGQTGLGAVLLFGSGFGALIGGVNHLAIPGKAKELQRARRGLERVRDKLDECEAELDYHHDVVSV
jgi:predicted RNA-binding Zn-ribbon protein involved in translation (DUF1610 family)